ncbi:MAG: RnfH family protein [Betaproteobacteria bacterium]|nr:RnfH family protein [Betaproteobacteria bacterium]MBV9362144.1 RnfH family protein [Betaproteobacteria bacterium]
MSFIRVEVVAAWPERAEITQLDLPAGSRVRDALRAAGVKGEAVGVFGKRVGLDLQLADGDRVEIYRPLGLDPKERRRQRARDRKKGGTRTPRV